MYNNEIRKLEVSNGQTGSIGQNKKNNNATQRTTVGSSQGNTTESVRERIEEVLPEKINSNKKTTLEKFAERIVKNEKYSKTWYKRVGFYVGRGFGFYKKWATRTNLWKNRQ